MADLATELRTYLKTKTAVTAVLSEGGVAANHFKLYSGYLPITMGRDSRYADLEWQDRRDLPAATMTIDIDEDYRHLNGLVGLERATVTFDCYSLFDADNNGQTSHIKIRTVLRNALGALKGKINSSLDVRDCIPLSTRTTIERSADSSNRPRFIAVAEFSISYATTAVTIGV